MTTYPPAPGSSGGEDRPASAIVWKPAPDDQQGDAVTGRRVAGPSRPRQAGRAWLDPSARAGIGGAVPPEVDGGTPPDDGNPSRTPVRYCGTHGENCPDLQRRAVSTRSSKPQGVSAHHRSPRARCGWGTLLQSTRNPTAGKAVWWRCEARDCPDCGPAKRERDLTHDLGNLLSSGRPVVRRVIDDFDPATWKRLRAKVKRAAECEGVEGGWVAYPTHGRMLVVFAVVGMTGALVTSLTDELADAHAGLPAGEKIRRPRCWALNPKPAGKGEAGPSYRLLGAHTVTHRAPDVLKRLGLYRDQVDEGAVPPEAWEAHNFTVPPLDSLAYRALVEAFDLQEGQAKPRKRRRAAA